MNKEDKELLLEVSQRLRGEGIRHEHDAAEARISNDWFGVDQHWRVFTRLRAQADAICRALL